MTLPKPTFRDIILLIAIGILVVFLWKGCGDKKSWQQAIIEKESARKKSVDSLQLVLDSTKLITEKRIGLWEDSAESLLAEVTVLRYERDQSWVGLEKNKKAADALIAKIRDKQGKDSADCIELTERYVDAAGQVVKYKNKTDELIAKLDTAGSYKDSVIKEQKRLTQVALQTGLETAKAYSALHASFKRLSPHNSWWIGGKFSGSALYQQAGGQMAFQNKKGVQYMGGVGIHSLGGTYIEGGILFKISFRKR